LLLCVVLSSSSSSVVLGAECGKVVTVGTASTQPVPTRAGPLTVVAYGSRASDCEDRFLFFDVGHGSSRRWIESGRTKFQKIEGIFLSNIHSDKVIDLGPVLYYSWLAGFDPDTYDGVDVYAPAGNTADYARSALDGLAVDIESRPYPTEPVVRVHDYAASFSEPAVLLETEEVTVTALRVDHFDVAVSWRVDIRDVASVVVSADISNDGDLGPLLFRLLEQTPNATMTPKVLVHEIIHDVFSNGSETHSNAATVVDRALDFGADLLVLSHMLPSPCFAELGAIPIAVPFLSQDDFAVILEDAGWNGEDLVVADDMTTIHLPDLQVDLTCTSPAECKDTPDDYVPLRTKTATSHAYSPECRRRKIHAGNNNNNNKE